MSRWGGGGGLDDSATAAPDCPGYRIIDISDLDLLEDGATLFKAFGVNDRGEVVGTFEDDGNVYAFHWQPTNVRAGVYGGTFNVLPLSSTDPAQANEINNAGMIVGVFDDGAYRWNAADTSGLDNAALPTSGSSRATAINDASPPLIVGDYTVSGFTQAYRFELGGVSVTDFVASDPDWQTFAEDISNDVGGDPVTAGHSIDDALFCGAPLFACIDGWAWEDFDDMELDQIESDSRTEAYGVSDVGSLVGGSVELIGAIEKALRPVYWRDSNSEVVILPVLTDDVASVARAISDPMSAYPDDLLHAVGDSQTFGEALHWSAVIGEDEQGDWTLDRLICLIGCEDSVACDGGRWERLVEAHDINDAGWIVGWGVLDPYDVYEDEDELTRAFLLVPLDACPGDISGSNGSDFPDGEVSTSDLLTLLAAWGDTGDCPSELPSDLDCSGEVDTQDLLILLANWGTCDGFPNPAPPSLSAVLASAGLDMYDWNDFMDVLGGESEQQRDRYLCWMLRYLTQCINCPSCPGTDPY